MHVLVATRSVHTTAAAADYLEGRLPADATVTVVGLAPPSGDATADESDSSSGAPAPSHAGPDRDAGDAVNVARSRLAAFGPTVETRAGVPGPQALRAAVADHDPDEVLIGRPGTGTGDEASSGEGGDDTLTTGLDDPTASLLAALDRPAVVVPVPTLDPWPQA